MRRVFAIVTCSDVKAKYSNRVFATDASLHKGAIASKEISMQMAKVLWLGGDKKGSYTSLDPPFRALRRAHEIAVDELEEFDEGLTSNPVPKHLEFSFDFVEVCGGIGSVSKSLASLGRNVMCAQLNCQTRLILTSGM